ADSLADDALHGAKIRLRGPAPKPGAVLLERELEAHGRISSRSMQDEWRVEIDLDDEAHGFGIGERLRAHSLDNEARKRLGGRVVVTRAGPRVFLYAGREAEAREAEAVARELVAKDDLSAAISVTRWH